MRRSTMPSGEQPGGPAAHLSDPPLLRLREGGVEVLLDVGAGGLPAILHWGPDLGDFPSGELAALAVADVPPAAGSILDVPIRCGILPEQGSGWMGRPGVSGSRGGRAWSPLFTTERIEQTGSGVLVDATDSVAGLGISVEIELLPSGLLRARATLTNLAADAYQLDALSLAFPVPSRAQELLDFAGRWGKERTPQRSAFVVGTHLREGRRGRTGADAATLLSAGTTGFGFGHGEVWGVHTAFSGNHVHYAERRPHGVQVLGGGELLLPGEVLLGPDESYRSPWLYGAYGTGLDEQAARFHRYLRDRPTHPRSSRPVTLNVWEAVYFDHDLEKLLTLADLAAQTGVERFVLDDGWFQGRRDSRSGLGDWTVDRDVWPNGLTPLVERVRALGMQFGLWFEPEMVSPGSGLARAHPEWVMQTGGRLPPTGRHQQVLNLGIPEAYAHILERIAAIVGEYRIDYIKWDHNRDLVDAGTSPDGRPGVHEQTLAVYRMLDELAGRFPGLEVESCSSGGARVDLGIIERAQRVWVSDCIDPLERLQMTRWTMQLLPPELLGSHVASSPSHTTGRHHALSFRAGVAIFGHFGIEWDLTRASADELAELRQWVSLYRELRPLLHTGALVRMDGLDPTLWITGLVSPDRRHALYALATVGRPDTAPYGRAGLRGLDPETRYRVTLLTLGSPGAPYAPPPWAAGERSAPDGDGPGAARENGIVLTGRVLDRFGIQVPASYPDRVLLLEVRAAD